MKKKIAIVSVVIVALFFAGNLFLRSIYVVPIVMYHSIDLNDKGTRLVITPENFKRQMEFLKRHRYNVISLGELADILNLNKKIPKKTICITFDDGYENNYRYAYPVLKGLNIPVTIFVMTDSIDRPNNLTSKEIQEMVNNSAVSIGSHTKTHFWLGGKNLEKAREEVFESKKILERLTSKKVAFFSYPAGGFTKDTRQLVIDAGYKGAVATNPGKKYPKHDIYALKRLRISNTCNNPFVFWIVTTGYYTWIKEHRDKD